MSRQLNEIVKELNTLKGQLDGFSRAEILKIQTNLENLQREFTVQNRRFVDLQGEQNKNKSKANEHTSMIKEVTNQVALKGDLELVVSLQHELKESRETFKVELKRSVAELTTKNETISLQRAIEEAVRTQKKSVEDLASKHMLAECSENLKVSIAASTKGFARDAQVRIDFELQGDRLQLQQNTIAQHTN